ncbi:unnamed protein product [Paramecium octaurelia]|uniref:Rhomboid-like protease n=1 Tax=Paramecium octaurelia TaxID=43137 RepID=A0A8S1VRI0_PAROT|nr:unnamed protein product [Paramecium octaurelia]
MNSQIQSNPREESFLQMLHYSICPLMKRNSFTYWIIIIDLLHYFLSLIYQQTQMLTLRPHQKVLFNFGQLYPIYTKSEFWRLLLSLEQHKNETHLFFSLLFKMHFFSFIEHNIGFRNTILIYFMSGISSTLFQAIVSQQVGVCGSFHVGAIGYALYLQQQMLQKCSAQQQLQFYFDLQVSQDYGLTLIKVVIVLSIMYITSLKFHGILMIGSLLFGIQCMILGQYFSYEQKKQQQLQLTNSTKQTQLTKYIYLSGSIAVIIIEVIVFFQLKNHIEI